MVLRRLRESLNLLATRRFGTFWFASLSSIGTWTQQVALQRELFIALDSG